MILTLLVALACLAWLGVWLHPARPWDFQPHDAYPLPPEPANGSWPTVAIIVPARNEADSLPHTLPGWLNQDYPGPFHLFLVDDRSQDGTGERARQIARDEQASERLTVVSGQPLPAGWMGKVWAMQQGAEAALQRDSSIRYFLLTDADIAHTPDSLRALVLESEAESIDLNSRMARLRCVSFWEQLLIPPFVFFFILLYPMRWTNRKGSWTSGAAGGCVLLRRSIWEQLPSGFGVIRQAVIDDCSLARAVRQQGGHLKLSLSDVRVQSLRPYPHLADIWKMVARSAFAQLDYSWPLLLGSVLFLAIQFFVPEAVLVASLWWRIDSILVLGAVVAILLRWRVYQPAANFFRVPFPFRFTLPLAGILYGAMTVSSALRHAQGRGPGWRELPSAPPSSTVKT